MNARLSFERHGKDWPNRDVSRFLFAAELNWHVQILGKGPVMLLVHGTGASTHCFRELAAILSNAYTVVMPDLPGHGFTEMPATERLSLPSMAEDLSALLRTLDMRPAIVVGHSAGAAILVQMCLEKAISPHVIVSINGAFLPFGSFIGQLFSPLAKLLVLNPLVPSFLTWRAGREGTVEHVIRNTGSNIDAEGIGFYRRLFECETHVASALGMMAKWDLSRLERRLPELNIPLVLVTGSQDRAIAPSQAYTVRERVKKSKVIRLSGLGHLAHEERPEEIAEIVAKAAREYRQSAFA